jgi:integrase
MKEIQSSSTNDVDIKNCIESAAEKLYLENKTLMGVQIEALANAETITPYIAAQLYAYDYVTSHHPQALNERAEAIAQKLQRDCKRLSAIAMCEFTPAKMKANFKNAKMGILAQEELYKFFDFCSNYGIYDGSNPVEKPVKKRKTGRAKQIKATRPDELTPELQDRFYDKINTNITASKTAVAILASGLDPKEIVELKWKDLTFKTEDDYVIVHLERLSRLSATHNYSRPLVPRSASVVREYYKREASATRGNMSEKYVFPQAKNKRKHMVPATIIEEATRILHTIGVGYGIMGELHRENRKMASAKRILYCTYERNIRDVCSLESDPGTVNFLLKRPFGNDVTADSYTSFTSETGSNRLYDILKALRKAVENNNTYDEQYESEKVIRSYYPNTNKEYLGILGEIIVPPGEEIVISCEHGFDGEYTVTRIKENDGKQIDLFTGIKNDSSLF